jgi:hypothetical protein
MYLGYIAGPRAAFPQVIANTSENAIFKRNYSSDSFAPIKAIYPQVGKFE